MATDSLLKKLRGEGCRTVEIAMLEPAPLNERVEWAYQWCLRAAKSYDDKEAMRLYEYLTLAVQDASGNRAQTAIRLYREIPATKKTRVMLDRETYESEDVERPALVELKKKLLADVAECWSQARDKQEAAQLEVFFIEVAQTSKHAQEWLAEAMVAGTKHVWKKERAIMLMMRFVGQTGLDGDKNPARNLLTGVVRTLSSKEILTLGTILLQLPFDGMFPASGDLSGEAVFTVTANVAENVRLMHEAMRDLKQALRLSPSQIYSFEPEYSTHRPLVKLAIGIGRSYSSTALEDNEFHDLAHAVRDQVRAWYQTRSKSADGTELFSRPRIQLEVFQAVRHGTPTLARAFVIADPS